MGTRVFIKYFDEIFQYFDSFQAVDGVFGNRYF